MTKPVFLALARHVEQMRESCRLASRPELAGSTTHRHHLDSRQIGHAKLAQHLLCILVDLQPQEDMYWMSLSLMPAPLQRSGQPASLLSNTILGIPLPLPAGLAQEALRCCQSSHIWSVAALLRLPYSS